MKIIHRGSDLGWAEIVYFDTFLADEVSLFIHELLLLLPQDVLSEVIVGVFSISCVDSHRLVAFLVAMERRLTLIRCLLWWDNLLNRSKVWLVPIIYRIHQLVGNSSP